MSQRGSAHLLQAQLDALQAQNTRLTEENLLLRHKLQVLTSDQRSTSVINVEARIRALQFEDERDRMYENLEKIKKKYNKLHSAFLDKVQHCKALDEMFKRQKTLTGLVLKSSLKQKENAPTTPSTNDVRGKNVETLQCALDEAYDLIDELEFELESIDYLELENQRMRKELTALKTGHAQAAAAAAAAAAVMPDNDESPPPYETADEPDGAEALRYVQPLSVASSSRESLLADDADSELLERSALTHSLLQNAEAESKQLRRELLKCRLQNTLRPKRDFHC